MHVCMCQVCIHGVHVCVSPVLMNNIIGSFQTHISHEGNAFFGKT